MGPIHLCPMSPPAALTLCVHQGAQCRCSYICPLGGAVSQFRCVSTRGRCLHVPLFVQQGALCRYFALCPPGGAVSLVCPLGGAVSMSRYEPVSTLGSGSSCSVFRARDRRNGRLVALKRVRVGSGRDGLPHNAVREVALLRSFRHFRHPNIVRLLDVCAVPRPHRGGSVTLVLEHVERDLRAVIDSAPQRGLPHSTAKVVTLWYRAPEVLLLGPYSSAVDLWSVGCIFAEMLSRTPLFCGSSELEQLGKIFDVLGLPPKEEWPPDAALPHGAFSERPPTPPEDIVPHMGAVGTELLLELLQFRPQLRISAQSALQHRYLQGTE
ncbi:cyclin-dependent kinase 4 isoform X5 [Coturnix japonica]|uniref:cyclin-dependent kinase 4 isoform X5 n=1 Tax=Coturnix japonica TaxID=93934 RepID=UPI0007772D05|nr:cyclin-dependent kinase 4 isoform X5 [Coturnix japonica]